MLAADKLRLRILSLTCHLADEDDGDEVFLVLNKNKIWPTNKKFISLRNGKTSIEANLSDLDKDAALLLELWDYDRFSANDHLGDFNMLLNEKGGPYNTDLTPISKKSNARYTLEWEVY